MQWASWNTLGEISMPILGYPLMFPTAQIGTAVSTDVELQAIESVYRAGLRAGA